MDNQHIILCGGQPEQKTDKQAAVLRLNAWAAKGTPDYVGLKIEDLHGKLYKPVPRQFEDLIDIATYVYCADQAISRGGIDVDTFGGRWRRRFHFHIPVREPDLWNSKEVKQTLVNTLSFLSEDDYDFTFTGAVNAPGMDGYFPNFSADVLKDPPAQVVLFSGGLDSLAGAITEAVQEKRHVMLVNHRPTDKLNNVHKKLERLLADKAGRCAPRHLHVHINKRRQLNKSYLQRARSFLYVSIGATVAEMLGQQSVRFYENGVVSVNLPVSVQVVGSQATRTTHPRVLAGYSELMRLVSRHAFTVENPFIWNTKAEVVEKIVKADCADLIGASISCAHTYTFSNEHPHCGTCSQCIDRRFGILAAKADSFDPATGYKSDVFTGKRPTKEDRMMVALYLERAKLVAGIKTPPELISRFPDVVRTLKYYRESPQAAAEKIVSLHQRHGKEVKAALGEMISRHKDAIADNSLHMDCLLRIAFDSGGGEIRIESGEGPGGGHARIGVLPKKFHKQQEERWEKEKEKPTSYRLRRGLGGFLLVYKGELEQLNDDRGVRFIEYLLKHSRDEPIHAVVLEAKVDGTPASDGFLSQEVGAGEMEDLMDSGLTSEAAGKKLMGSNISPVLDKELSELRIARDDESLPATEREDAQKRISSLLKDLQKGGKMAGQAGLAADRVRKAMKTVIDNLKKAELRRGVPNTVLQEFGKHLEECLWVPSMGGKGRAGAAGKPGCYTYERPTGVTWRD